MVEFTPEKSKKIALARLDLLNQWKEFRKKSDNKLQADYDFVNLHNTSNSHLFEILGKISRGSLHRWKNILNGTEDYTKLIPQYRYAKVDEYRTCLTDEEIKIFMGLLLHPNRLCIGKAIALTKYKLKEQGQSYITADITFRKYANWFKKNNYDKWVLARDGEKTLSDKVEPYIKRDASLLDVGDILVADGHKLAFNGNLFRLPVFFSIILICVLFLTSSTLRFKISEILSPQFIPIRKNNKSLKPCCFKTSSIFRISSKSLIGSTLSISKFLSAT